eukprot:CAMPEP_0119105368 /NCGR_PEP_ID=MMETSP1180-20130426/3347_1 /TAXON_ID=3052 ORGANISM="Chlamydomonas cf sp, Strain CCMP681" /NCGR_SAMPLE_ID=MMETSP1180 /ASSEMBLY_ACC=CAM_ASM_000741 /LENGTH=266 /DNA_ID=CAMNT_0007090397 /DNA_START=325 /DNA_END=1125 /DNA_ORIENTATION=+
MILLNSQGAQAALPPPDTVVGQARVVDGDTLAIGDARLRLYGMDAPESRQACVDARGADYMCGIVSKEKLTEKVANQTVSCKVKNSDQYGRLVAVCSLAAQPVELNKWLVDNGLAVAYRQYSKDYIASEDAAKAARVGIWAGSFENPAQWRKDDKAKIPHPPFSPVMPNAPPPRGLLLAAVPVLTNRTPTPIGAITPAQAGACPDGTLPTIKGNINAKGVKIYHVPGGPSYTTVKVEPSKGESYFCTTAEAEKAGFRPIIVKAAAS